MDVVGAQRGNPEVTWTSIRSPPGALGLTVADVASQLSAAGSARSRPICGCSIAPSPCASGYPDAVPLRPARLAQTPVRGSDGQLVPLASARARRSQQRAERGCCARTCGRWRSSRRGSKGATSGSAVAELRGAAREALTLPVGYTLEVGGQYESQRQAFRELLLVFGVAAALVLPRPGGAVPAFMPALLILAAAPLSLGGAFAAAAR